MSHTLYLIRHGATESTAGHRVCGATDVALSERGLKEMEAVARYFSGKELSRVFSSPLQRARLPAAALAAEKQIPHVVFDELAEVNFGDWEGKSVAEVLVRWPLQAARAERTEPDFTFPNGERIADFQARTLRAFQSIRAELSGPAAVFTHGGVLKMIAGHIRKLSLRESKALDFSTGSISVLEWKNGSHELATHNFYGHLPPLE